MSTLTIKITAINNNSHEQCRKQGGKYDWVYISTEKIIITDDQWTPDIIRVQIV